MEFDFVWDLLAKTAGAEIRPFDEIEAQAETAVHAMSEAQAFLARNSNKNTPEWVIIESFERDLHLYQHQLYDALVEVDLNQLPGYNKPTQAVRLLWLFRAMQRLWVLRILQIAVELSFIEALAGAFKKIDALSEQDIEMLEAFVGGNEPNEEALLLGLELTMSGLQVDEMLRIGRKLSELSELHGQSKLTPDPNGEEVVLRDIKELSELGRAAQAAWALPKQLRIQRAVSGELPVRESRTRRTQKQLLFMVVDGSRSMLHDGRLGASRAAGIVMNRLRAVIDGDAELYLRFFDGALREEEFHADSPESARELMRIVSDPAQYMGYTTEFTGTLTAASKRSEEIVGDRDLRDPEIVFITDGQATVPSLSVVNGKLLHAFQVGVSENSDLTNLARQSGGIGAYLGLQDWK
ncbi:MAG TPA: hypothetical protein VD907_04065 [Verrucomicrobiae bacterium]|nr:hypothetical protein [Verrucomicrobiae bacterium]